MGVTQGEPLYVFIDESGNYDFKPQRSAYFVLTAVATQNPVQGAEDLLTLRHGILWARPDSLSVRKPHEYAAFHCTEDAQSVRDRVFGIISGLRYDSYCVVVQKNKANPVIREQELFYQRVFRALILGMARRRGEIGPVQIIASSFTLSSRREAFLGALKMALSGQSTIGRYNIHFHPSASHHMLQVSDYIGWAIYRKWEHHDSRSYDRISHVLRMEFDMFRKGTHLYY